MGDIEGLEVTGLLVGAMVVGEEVGFADGETVGLEVDFIGLADGR